MAVPRTLTGCRKWFSKLVRPSPRRQAFQPRLEWLEERSLLAAGALDPTFGICGTIGAKAGTAS